MTKVSRRHHTIRAEPMGIGNAGSSEHGDERDLQAGRGLDPDAGTGGGTLLQPLRQDRGAREERRLTQIMVILLEGITSGPDGPREQLVHEARQ